MTVVVFGWMLVDWGIQRQVRDESTVYLDYYPVPSSLMYIVMHLGMSMSLGVAIAWITLAIVGRWRPDRGWDDRLGRLVGCFWLIYGPGESLVNALMAH